MTRHEYGELLSILEQLSANNRRGLLTIQTLLDLLRQISRQLEAEDNANTSRDKQEANGNGSGPF